MVFPALEACTCQDNCVNIIVLARKIVKMMIVMTILMMIMMTILKIKMTAKFRIGDAN